MSSVTERIEPALELLGCGVAGEPPEGLGSFFRDWKWRAPQRGNVSTANQLYFENLAVPSLAIVSYKEHAGDTLAGL